MKGTNLFANVVAVLIVTCGIALAGEDQNKPDDPKTLNVDKVAKDPKAYAGRIAVEGVVARVVKDKAFTIIDAAEYAQCNSLTCAEFVIPLTFPKDEFKGDFPKPKDKVLAIGDLQITPTGYRIVVQEVRREKKTILSRTKAPSGNSVLQDHLPGTLLINKDALRLNDDQVSKLKEMQGKLLETESKLNEKIAHCQAELVELLEKKPVHQEKVDHEKKEIEELKQKIKSEKEQFEKIARAVLTSDQSK